MEQRKHETTHGSDAVSVLYILAGIPALVGFIVVLFSLVRACNLPA